MAEAPPPCGGGAIWGDHQSPLEFSGSSAGRFGRSAPAALELGAMEVCFGASYGPCVCVAGPVCGATVSPLSDASTLLLGDPYRDDGLGGIFEEDEDVVTFADQGPAEDYVVGESCQHAENGPAPSVLDENCTIQGQFEAAAVEAAKPPPRVRQPSATVDCSARATERRAAEHGVECAVSAPRLAAPRGFALHVAERAGLARRAPSGARLQVRRSVSPCGAGGRSPARWPGA